MKKYNKRTFISIIQTFMQILFWKVFFLKLSTAIEFLFTNWTRLLPEQDRVVAVKNEWKMNKKAK